MSLGFGAVTQPAGLLSLPTLKVMSSMRGRLCISATSTIVALYDAAAVTSGTSNVSSAPLERLPMMAMRIGVPLESAYNFHAELASAMP